MSRKDQPLRTLDLAAQELFKCRPETVRVDKSDLECQIAFSSGEVVSEGQTERVLGRGRIRIHSWSSLRIGVSKDPKGCLGIPMFSTDYSDPEYNEKDNVAFDDTDSMEYLYMHSPIKGHMTFDLELPKHEQPVSFRFNSAQWEAEFEDDER